MRKKESTFLRVFFQIFNSKNLKNHWKRRDSLNKIKIFPLMILIMTGLITMINITSPIAVTVENQRLYPFSSDVILKDNILENQTLFYQTFYQQTLTQALCDSEFEEFESPLYRLTNVTQEITFDSSNNLLNIQEKVDQKEFGYNITSTSNIPEATILNYSYRNGWQHNYPKEASEITLNTQEITNLAMNRENYLVSTYVFEENKSLEYGDLIIPTQVFKNSNSSSFEMFFGLG